MSSARHAIIGVVVLFAALTWSRQAPADTVPALADPVSRFIDTVSESTANPVAKNVVLREWDKRKDGTDLRTFIPEALAVLHPRFHTALRTYDAGEYAYCAKIMGALTVQPDPFLATHAVLFQAKALMQDVHLEYATLLLEFFFREDFDVREYTADAAELNYLYGYCLFHTFEVVQAAQTLQDFLDAWPAADPTLRASAKDMLAALEPPPRKDLAQAAHLMADAGLWLTEGDSGLDPQTRQRKAMLILDELIRQAQKQEQQQQQQQQSGGASQSASNTSSPSRPAAQSSAPGGEGSGGEQHEAPLARPGEVWGQMKPQERERIFQALQQSFPSRYRQLVEQYYTELAGQD